LKRIIICSDGTWNRPDQREPSNVVKLSNLIAPEGPGGITQTVFYDLGVGTGNIVDRLTGGAFGRGLDNNIEDNYRFLVHNFTDGDEIYLFGFSRGAYTVRSTVGLIRKCGVLRKEHAGRIRDAYNLYRRRDASADEPESVKFRADYSRVTDVKFVGVFDTVGALGMPVRGLRFLSRGKYEFHDTQLSSKVKFAYHALAIDEHRTPFKPTLWTNVPKPGQTVEQVWFAGAHSDIGGSSDADGLGDVSLQWMISRASACGLAFHEADMRQTVRPNPLGPVHDSKVGLYKFTRGFDRPLGSESASTEAVHRAVVRRTQESDPGYSPKNVAAYMTRDDRRVAG
jgi:uncharacterized protein (DUF2235 family)